MKVLFLHAAADLYGSDRACLEVAREAVARGWEVTVTVPGSGPLVDELTAVGARVLDIDPLKPRRADLQPARLASTLTRWWQNWGRLRQLTRRMRADLVYSTTAPTLGGFYVARRWGAVHAYHVHEIFWFPALLVRGFERIVRRADLIIHCSEAVRDQFTDPGIKAVSHVVHTGSEVPGGILERQPVNGPPFRLVCVARLNEWKGQEVLVDAVARLVDAGHDVILTLVGDVYADQVRFRHGLERQVADLGLQDRVELLGERRDALEIIAGCDVFVLPSRRPEPFGMALVEAMALGRPVVATDAGGPREIVTDGVDGLLVSPGDPGELATAIARILDEPEWAGALADAARRRSDQFSISTMRRRTVDLLEQAHHERSVS